VLTEGDERKSRKKRIRRVFEKGALPLYQRTEYGFGHVSAVASLSIDQMIRPKPGFASVLDFARRLSEVELVTDLGANVGSPVWFRSLATCSLLCASTYLFIPDIKPLVAPVPAPVMGDAWEETRAQSIGPLAWGADTGRRMAATDAVVPLGNAPERPTLDLSATLGQGDGFSRVLQRAGVGDGEARRITDLVNNVTPVTDIVPGTRMTIVLGRRANRNLARPLQSLDFRARFDLSLKIVQGSDGFAVVRTPIAVDRTPLRIQGSVGDSLYRSARAAGAPPKSVEAYIVALASKLSLGADVTSDARFDLIVEHARAQTGETQTGKLLYVGLTRGGRQTQLLQWTIGGRTEWFEASGVGQKRGGMTSPVAGAHQTSGYGMRFHPILGYNRFHRGIDFGAPYGSPIHAVTDGIISFAGRSGGYGNHVAINHSGGLGTSYSHMSRIIVSPGARVTQGQVIGYVGSTGLSTGPHLHFETYRNGQLVSPNSVRFASTSLLSGDELASFRSRLAALLTVPVATAAPQPK
jgi:murein DD-endopeptidase MepM/ murein hydrolase activator NlpD